MSDPTEQDFDLSDAPEPDTEPTTGAPDPDEAEEATEVEAEDPTPHAPRVPGEPQPRPYAEAMSPERRQEMLDRGIPIPEG